MPEPKWTPGPWKFQHREIVALVQINKDSGPDQIEVFQLEVPILRTTHASFWTQAWPYGYETGTANGYLAAAAPDLYQAVDELIRLTPAGPCQKGLVDPCQCEACKVERAIAALAKARGETNV